MGHSFGKEGPHRGPIPFSLTQTETEETLRLNQDQVHRATFLGFRRTVDPDPDRFDDPPTVYAVFRIYDPRPWRRPRSLDGSTNWHFEMHIELSLGHMHLRQVWDDE